MKLFKLSEAYSVVCEWKKTRSGFKHEATLLHNGVEVETVKCCYQNRTWESYKYESVLQKLLGRNFIEEDVKRHLLVTSGRAKSELDSTLKTVGAIASLGDLFCNGKKESNDWKARMLKAGLPGLNIPEDWDSLTEDEKESRLNKVIAFNKGAA